MDNGRFNQPIIASANYKNQSHKIKKRMRISEAFSLILSNFFLITCSILNFWVWRSFFCSPMDYGCYTECGLWIGLFMWVCLLPILPWALAIICVICTSKFSNRRRTIILSSSFVITVLLMFAWLWAALIKKDTIIPIIISNLASVVLIISDVVYSRLQKTKL